MSDSLKGSVVLVTGGAGLIGSHIVDLLIEEGAREIRVLDNLIRGRMENLPMLRRDLPIVFVHGDVRNRDQVAEVAGEPGGDGARRDAGVNGDGRERLVGRQRRRPEDPA